MKKIQYTRGKGILEGFLVKQRARKANSFITEKHRQGRILDLGCGSYPYFLISTNFNEKFGLDPSLKISEVKEKTLNLKTLNIAKQNLPYENNYFNVVTMLAVFEHIDQDKLQHVLNEIKRVLKKNGLFIITTPAPWSDKLLHFMAKFGIISSDEIHEHKHSHSRKKIANILTSSGFDNKNIKHGFFELFMNMWFIVDK